MQLKTCDSCWQMPCTCGREYKGMSIGELKALRKLLKHPPAILAEMIFDAMDEEESWSGPGNR